MARPDISALEVAAVNEVLATPFLAMGPRTLAFERALAERIGARHAVAVSSGTAALHLALVAAGVGRGDLVITSPFSFVASANVARYEGAIPIFVDIDPDTLHVEAPAIEAAVRALQGDARAAVLPRRGAADAGRVAAVLPVHLFGRAADIEGIGAIASRSGLALIQDACEAIGTERGGRFVGSRPCALELNDPHAAAFGFYPNKQITTGEGGAVVTDRDDWADLIRSLRNQGRDPSDSRLHHRRLGYSYRLDELSAALGVVQLQRLDELIEQRARVARGYALRLAGIEGVVPLPAGRDVERISWFVYPVRIAPEIDRDELMDALRRLGIPARPYFTPIHLQPCYRDRFGYREGDFPHAEAAGRCLLALPFYGTMSDDELDIVAEALRSRVSECAR